MTFDHDEEMCRLMKETFIEKSYSEYKDEATGAANVQFLGYSGRSLETNLADLMECVDIPVLCATIIRQLGERNDKLSRIEDYIGESTRIPSADCDEILAILRE